MEISALDALLASSRAFDAGSTLDELLDEVVTQAQRLADADRCALLLYDPATEVFSVERTCGSGTRISDFEGMSAAVVLDLAVRAARDLCPFRTSNLTSDPGRLEVSPGMRSTIVVPLIAGNEVAAVIIAESARADAFSELHEKLLSVSGSHIALAIVAQRKRKRLEERVEHLGALHKISQLASLCVREGFEEVLDTALEVARDLVPVGHAAILLMDPESLSLRVHASDGYQDGVERLDIPLGRGITGRAAKLGKPLIIPDVEAERDYLPGVPGARSEIALPLTAEGQVIGVLNCESLEPDAYHEEHVRTLKLVAQHLAVVLRTAQLHAEARRLSITDPLTGLYNRRFFMRQLEDAIGRAQRYAHRLALVFGDLDRFKSINDRFGHHTGDRALQAVSAVMRRSIRGTDMLARMGGEEFAALLMEADCDRALQVGHRFLAHIRQLGFRADDNQPVSIGISAGIALFPEHGESATALLRHADEALYEAKRLGGNQVVIARVLPASAAVTP
jgi:diguanylate cyclase (GGDEF)-like protein